MPAKQIQPNRVLRTLTCRLQGLPGSPLPPRQAYDYSAEKAFHRDLAHQFKLKDRNGSIEVTLDDSLAPFLDHIEALQRKKIARAHIGISEQLAYRPDAGWYVIRPTLEFNPRNRKAGKAEVLQHPWMVASERFREAAEHAKLAGLVYTVVYSPPITGDRRTWFSCAAARGSGRGVDHPWAPPREEKIAGVNVRIGSWSANYETAVKDKLDPLARRLYELVDPTLERSFWINSYPRLWSGAMPEADFCALPSHGRKPCIGNAGATALLKAGVLTPEMLVPIDIVASETPESVPILDVTLGPTSDLDSKYANAESVPMPATATRKAKGKSAPRRKSAAKKPSKPFLFPQRHPDAENVTEKDIVRGEEKCDIEIAPMWAQVLLGLGIYPLGDMEPHHPKQWLDRQPRDDQHFRDANHNLPADLFFVGDTASGDSYALDLGRISRSGDCPVLKFNHENSQCEDRWPNIIAFLKQVTAAKR